MSKSKRIAEMTEKEREQAKANSLTYRLKNREKLKERTRLWRLENPDKVKTHRKKYDDANLEKRKEKRKAKDKRYREKNRQYYRDKNKEYRQSHKFDIMLNSAKNRALRKSIPFDLTVELIEKLWNDQNGLCFYSGKSMILESNSIDTVSIDRIDSSMGYTLGNIRLCRKSINTMKLDLTLEVFIRIIKEIHTHQNTIYSTATVSYVA